MIQLPMPLTYLTVEHRIINRIINWEFCALDSLVPEKDETKLHRNVLTIYQSSRCRNTQTRISVIEQ